MKFGLLLQPVDSFKLMLSVNYTNDVQGTEVCLGGFIRNTYNTSLYSGVYTPISFFFCMMITMSKLYSLIAVQ